MGDGSRDRLDAERYRQLRLLAKCQVIDDQTVPIDGKAVACVAKADITLTIPLPKRPAGMDDPFRGKEGGEKLDAILDLAVSRAG
jgi:hypothetical protein